MRPVWLIVGIVALAGPCAQAQRPTDLEYRQELLIQIGVANLDRAIAFYTRRLVSR